MNRQRICEDLTAIILTFNEQENIERTLKALMWVPEVLLIDSGSNDQTRTIALSFPNVRIVERVFDSFAEQCNFALSQVGTEWALSLDADYRISATLSRTIMELKDDRSSAGFRVGFEYQILGRSLRGSLYPPRTVLYRRTAASYVNEGHGHRVKVEGPVQDLPGIIYHDDRKPLARWIASQTKYAKLEADHLLSADRKALGFPDKIRLMAWPAPFLAGVYALFAKGCILDGRAGWYYSLQRVLAETLLALELLDRRLRQAAKD
jgi:glycosyltransferase involved in cell wall biosynthesis